MYKSSDGFITRRLRLATIVVVLSAAFSPRVYSMAAISCADVAAELDLQDTVITSAEEVNSGTVMLRGENSLTGLPPFCRVAAVTKPAIKFEVWMPVTNWNGKFQGVGGDANAGQISYGRMAAALKRGYATASTDTGHSTETSRDGSWALGHRELMDDFGHRAIHVTADNAKKIVARYYSEPARYSYFVGCSTGGRQALMEAQRYPEDYDGIVAGAPAANWSQFQTGGHMWAAYAMNNDPESYVPAAKLKALGDAVLGACDKLDGVSDGLVSDPRQCHYDAKELQCPAGKDDDSCLTPKQVRTINDIWAGARTKSGKLIYPGYMRGAEGAQGSWSVYMSGKTPESGTHWDQAMNTLKYMVFEDADWNYHTFDVERDAALAKKKLGNIMDAFDPDLSRFQARGGKLILYHGWADPSISPLNTINYYESVIAALKRGGNAQQAQAKVQDFARLFLMPGMLHCGGGPGPNQFDMTAALETWVEQKQAPESVLTAHSSGGKVDRTRPACAYPRTAVYIGSGSTDEAANFVCK